ncbi:AMP-binding protein [Actinoplanes sp. NPDC049265]|uniref:AMP-binding protein n=1 Tax=Actinoplanes sp. NPDC049265 TaxID=3363902 RepID=UPI00372371B0
MNPAFIGATMARRGLLRPGSPAALARQLGALHTWGFGLAGELRQAAARSPRQVAVADDTGESLTYAELLDRSLRVAHALPAAPGDRVGILCRNSAGMLAALIGVTQLGADPVLINTGLPAAQLAELTAAQKLRLIIHDDEFSGVPPEVSLPMSALRLSDVTPAELRPPPRPSRTIVLTSGTTGTPKGARRPTPGGFGPLCSIIERIPLRRGTRVMIAAPLFHTWGFAALQVALALRATVVVRRRFDPALIVDDLQKCDALIAIPVMLQRIMELPEPGRRPPLDVVAVSGSALPGGLANRFMDRFGDVLYNLYGSTEVSWASIATPRDLRAAPGTAGRPPYGTTVTVRDAAGGPVASGVSGRLFVHNDMLFEGYTAGEACGQSPDPVPRERYGHAHPQGRGWGRWPRLRKINFRGLPTGDLGHIDDAGRVFVDGREDDMIVSGGENVFPSQVENLLADLPEIREAAVVGVPDDEFGQRLAAFVVLHDGTNLDADRIREHVRQHRARFCVPRDVVFLDALPRTTTGKILTRLLVPPPE